MAAWDDGPDCKVWTPSLTPANGDAAVIDGSEHFYFFNDSVLAPTYQTRDARRVIRSIDVPAYSGQYALWVPRGPQFDRDIFAVPETGWEWEISFYINKAKLVLDLTDGVPFQTVWAGIDTRTGAAVATLTGALEDDSTGKIDFFPTPSLPATGGWPVGGWYTLGIRIKANRNVQFQIKQMASADDWRDINTSWYWSEAATPIATPILISWRKHPEDAASLIDVWKYEWRNL